MIRELEGERPAFVLDTDNTTYAFSVMETGQLQHMYYGRRIHLESIAAMEEKHAFSPGNCNFYDNDHTNLTLEDVALEMSTIGKGDIRTPMVEAVCANGSTTLDFVFDHAEISKGKEEFKTLPGSYDDDNAQDHLLVVMKDKNHGFLLELHYYVYEKENVITRSAKFINASEEKIRLTRMLSMSVDLHRDNYVVTSFHGGWTKEMNRVDTPVNGGSFVNSSFTGCSSSRSNPFIFLSRPDTTETTGECLGFNLIYSGNHYEAVEVNSFHKTRVAIGINPQNFEFELQAGDEFEAPEAVMTYSAHGHNEMSQNLHAFVKKHIVRGVWRDKERPVLLNSWEASYFKFDEGSLVNLAKAGKEVGIELFVMDDGWFGTRNDDKQALGDWDVNTKKLPHGLDGLAKKINDLGMDFGIWIEPEMVNVDSDLYRAHPDWAIEIPGQDHTEGRSQRILDFANPEVVDYISEKMISVLGSANISYVKWDMNRTFSDYYSQYLDADHQQEVGHRYIMGVYRLMKTLTERFPEVLFEGCAAGGNRFDLGALCYFPQIWGSDNTDAVCRLFIQNGYSYGYPLSCVGAHVSSVPNHQTLRVTPLESRFAVAAFGVLGYELNLHDAKKEDLEDIKAQIALYKQYRSTLQRGKFYRRRAGNVFEWTVVSEDQSTAVGMIMQQVVLPGDTFETYTAVGLDENKKYHFFGLTKKYDIRLFGDLVNTASPIHIKQGSMIHDLLAKFVKMDGETEDYVCYGDELMYSGVKLKQSYAGTGYSDQVRFFPDFGSRLYFMEEEQ